MVNWMPPDRPVQCFQSNWMVIIVYGVELIPTRCNSGHPYPDGDHGVVTIKIVLLF